VQTLLVLAALALGALLAVQASANLQLSSAMGSPAGASAAQLAIGTTVLAALAAAIGSLGATGALGSAPAWHLVGGLGSALYITAGILLFPRFGALSAVGLFIAGQMLASLAVDGFGLLGVRREGLPASHVAGGLAVLAGAGAVARAAATGRRVAGHRAWAALGIAAGAGLAVQGPINAELRGDLEDAGGTVVLASAFSFVVATAAMALLLALWQARTHAPRPHAPGRTMPAWGYAGGLVGATYVTVVPLLIPELGAAATIGLTVAGQQVASLAVDRWGLLRLPRRPLTSLRAVGIAALLVGVALIQVA
jgi:bacterial/archaeal transporter family-2 protein